MQAVVSQLQKILKSRTFRRSSRLRHFLEFVVLEALHDRGHLLKEFTLGLEVFDKNQSFDPRLDPIVRVEAGRLRFKLRQYYDEEGRQDEIRIDIPRGGYQPYFQSRQAAVSGSPSRHRENGPVKVSIGGFANRSDEDSVNFFCERLAEEMTTILTEAESVQVLPLPSLKRDPAVYDLVCAARKVGAGMIIHGSVWRVDESLHITTRVLDTLEGSYLRSYAFDRSLQRAREDEIAQVIVDRLDEWLEPAQVA